MSTLCALAITVPIGFLIGATIGLRRWKLDNPHKYLYEHPYLGFWFWVQAYWYHAVRKRIRKVEVKWGTFCPTCQCLYRDSMGEVCSNPFHCCRDCWWYGGRVVKSCQEHRGAL